MKITKIQLRRIIKEACGGVDIEPVEPLPTEIAPVETMVSDVSSPCPFSIAEKLKSSGMSAGEVMDWVATVLSSYNDDMDDGGMLIADDHIPVLDNSEELA